VPKKKRKKKVQKRSRGGASYLCPRCQHPSHVVVTRREEDGDIRRYRECGPCGHKFTTLETEA
jgi:transcription elongation factor Elf1